MRHISIALALLAVCASRASAAPAKPCATAEYRQLDFWVGDWSVKVHARASPTSDQWADSAGTQHVMSIASRCAIEENFASLAPNAFAGKSLAMYDQRLQKWRQTWVDDSGSFLTFTGGLEGSDFVLYGESRGTLQMRMVFSKITHDALRWEWQRSEDGWKTHALMMAIDYTRAH